MNRKKPPLASETREYLRAIGSKGGAKGGKARWKGVSREEHLKVSRKGGLASAAARAKKKAIQSP